MKIKQASECDCLTCPGSEQVEPGTFGGMRCMCPCHQKKQRPKRLTASQKFMKDLEEARRNSISAEELATNLIERTKAFKVMQGPVVGLVEHTLIHDDGKDQHKWIVQEGAESCNLVYRINDVYQWSQQGTFAELVHLMCERYVKIRDLGPFIDEGEPQHLNWKQWLLLKLNEECLEVAQRASKCLCFGLTEEQGEHAPNHVRLLEEINDMMATLQMLRDEGMIGDVDQETMDAKKEKVVQYFRYAKEKCPKV